MVTGYPTPGTFLFRLTYSNKFLIQMDFSHSQELEMIAQVARDFARQHLLPHRSLWDKE